MAIANNPNVTRQELSDIVGITQDGIKKALDGLIIALNLNSGFLVPHHSTYGRMAFAAPKESWRAGPVVLRSGCPFLPCRQSLKRSGRDRIC